MTIVAASVYADNRNLFFKKELFADTEKEGKIQEVVSAITEKFPAHVDSLSDTIVIYLIYNRNDGKPSSITPIVSIDLGKYPNNYASTGSVGGISLDTHISISNKESNSIYLKGACVVTYPEVALPNGASTTEVTHGNIDYKLARREVKQLNRGSLSVNGHDLGETIIVLVWY